VAEVLVVPTEHSSQTTFLILCYEQHELIHETN